MTLGVFAGIERLVEYIPIHNDTYFYQDSYNINYYMGYTFLLSSRMLWM